MFRKKKHRNQNIPRCPLQMMSPVYWSFQKRMLQQYMKLRAKKNPTNTRVDTHRYVCALQQLIDEFRKGLLGRGSPVWVRPHRHIQAWAPSACTHKSHTPSPPPHTHSFTRFNMWYCSFHAVYYIMSFFSSSSRVSRWAERVGHGGSACTPQFWAPCVPLWASVGLFLTAAITTNNWTANEDKWYDCRARPSSQSAI